MDLSVQTTVADLGLTYEYPSRDEVRTTCCPKCEARAMTPCMTDGEPRRANHRERVKAHNRRVGFNPRRMYQDSLSGCTPEERLLAAIFPEDLPFPQDPQDQVRSA